MEERKNTSKALGKRITRKTIMRLVATVLSLMMIFVGVAACGDNNQGTGGNGDKTYGIGETGEVKNIKATLLGVTESTGSDYLKPEDGNVFILCEFEIENTSSKDLALSSLMCFKVYCDDYTCSISLGALANKGDSNQLDGTVAAGKKMKGVLGYEVPVDWQELEIHFTPDLLSKSELVFVAANS